MLNKKKYLVYLLFQIGTYRHKIRYLHVKKKGADTGDGWDI